MKKNKAIKAISLIVFCIACCLAIGALGLVSTAFAHANVEAIVDYVNEMKDGAGLTLTYVDFLTALNLGGIYGRFVTSCCLGLGSILCFAISRFMEVASHDNR